MWFLPEWAPNVHPLIVHFPIALLFLAGLMDITGLILKDRSFFSTASVSIYVLGGLSTLAAFLAGRAAADSVFLPVDANALLTEHADLGEYTFYFFGVFALIRLVIHFTNFRDKMIVRSGMTLLGLLGLGLLTITATRGSELVYRYGVGVEAIDHSVESVSVAVDSTGIINSDPVLEENGNWSWKPVRASAWRSAVRFLEPEDGLTMSSIVDGGEKGDVLGLSLSGGTTSFVVDASLNDIQIDTAINLDNFDGVLMIIHNVIDGKNYRFTSIGNGEVRQGRSENGDHFLYDQKPFEPGGWITIRVVNDDTHSRIYSDETMIAHGHGTAPAEGPVGIRLNGTGTALIDFMRVQALR